MQIMEMVGDEPTGTKRRTIDERIVEGERALEFCRQIGSRGFRATLKDAKGHSAQHEEFELDVERDPSQRERWTVKEEGEQRLQVRLPDLPRFGRPGLIAALPTWIAKADAEKLNFKVEALGAYVFAFRCAGGLLASNSSARRMAEHGFLISELSRGLHQILVCISAAEQLPAGRITVERPVSRTEAEIMAGQVAANLGIEVSKDFFLPGSVLFTDEDAETINIFRSAILTTNRLGLVNSGVLPRNEIVDAPAARAARGERTQYALANGLDCPEI